MATYSMPRLERAIRTYTKELDHLIATVSRTENSKSAVEAAFLRVLWARDDVHSLLADPIVESAPDEMNGETNGEDSSARVSGEAFALLLATDQRLKTLIQSEQVRERLSVWQESRTPSADAWWWRLPPPKLSALDRFCYIMAALLFIVGVSLAVDIAGRFARSGLDVEAALAIVIPAVITAGAARLQFSHAGQAAAQNLLAKVYLPRTWANRLAGAARRFGASPARQHRLQQLHRYPLLMGAWPKLVLLLALLLTGLVGGIWSRYLDDWSRHFSAQGESLRRDGQLAGARAKLERAIQLDPDNASAHYNLGVFYDQVYDYEHAIEHYQFAIAARAANIAALPTTLSPVPPASGGMRLDQEIARRAYNNLARAYIITGEPDKALILLEESATADGGACMLGGRYDFWTCKNYGWAWLEKGELEKAERYLRIATELPPGNASGHCLLAKALDGQRRFAEAQHQWQECRSRLAVTQNNTGNPADSSLAGDDFDRARWRAWVNQHANLAYYLGLARGYIQSGHYAWAASALRAAAGFGALLDGEKAEIATLTGWVYLEQARAGVAPFSLAEASLRQAIQWREQGAPAHCLLAQTLAEQDAEPAHIAAEWRLCMQYANAEQPDELMWCHAAMRYLTGHSLTSATPIAPETCF